MRHRCARPSSRASPPKPSADRESAVSLARRRQEALAVLDTLLASSPVGFAYVDKDLNCVLVNRVLAEMQGPAAESPVGRPLRDVLPRLAARLASSRPLSKIRFVSGYTDDVVIRQGVLDSGRAFLQKPFTPRDLLTKARDVLRG
jgi:PAS domain-containing protein